MAQRKIIAVIGSTGSQGGAVADALLTKHSDNFIVRAITRKPEGDKAKKLAARGAEVVQADIDDVASLTKAFTGAYGAYCVTNFWEHFSADKELQQAKNLAEAAKAAGIKHLVWSSLEDTRKWFPVGKGQMPTLQGKYNVPHFDAKGESNALFEGLPLTLYYTSFYWENFIYFGMGPKKSENGTYAIAFNMGDKKLPGIAVTDIGKVGAAIFAAGDKYIGKSVTAAGEHLTGSEYAEAFTKAFGFTVKYLAVPNEVYRKFPFPGADDLGNMFQFKHDANEDFCKARDVAAIRAMNPELMTFAQWLELNKKNIPIA